MQRCLSKTRNIGCHLVKGTHADRRAGAIRSPLTTTLPPMNRRSLRLRKAPLSSAAAVGRPDIGLLCHSASLPVAVARLGLQILQNRPIYAASRMSRMRAPSESSPAHGIRAMASDGAEAEEQFVRDLGAVGKQRQLALLTQAQRP
jgi:hypothetical protein